MRLSVAKGFYRLSAGSSQPAPSEPRPVVAVETCNIHRAVDSLIFLTEHRGRDERQGHQRDKSGRFIIFILYNSFAFETTR